LEYINGNNYALTSVYFLDIANDQDREYTKDINGQLIVNTFYAYGPCSPDCFTVVQSSNQQAVDYLSRHGKTPVSLQTAWVTMGDSPLAASFTIAYHT